MSLLPQERVAFAAARSSYSNDSGNFITQATLLLSSRTIKNKAEVEIILGVLVYCIFVTQTNSCMRRWWIWASSIGSNLNWKSRERESREPFVFTNISKNVSIFLRWFAIMRCLAQVGDRIITEYCRVYVLCELMTFSETPNVALLQEKELQDGCICCSR